ncbi:MAG TPA: outer membrane lipoprotein-sorting protein [Polyangiaceae bacterium]|nr:outer membrane lipoprotein-sorting protein [Polyangiaceae bacterium]
MSWIASGRARWFLAVAVFGASLVTAGASAESLDPGTQDARKIAKAAADRDDGDRQSARLTMTVIDGSGRKRVRGLMSRRLKFDKGTKLLMMFEEPADMRNTGFLLLDYRDSKRDDDQWLYLPSLRKTTRISSSDRSGSFLGSDISYSDLLRPNVDHYEYKLLEASAQVDGEECWRLEARPRSAKVRDETGYVKTEMWISKKKLVPVQSKMWVQNGKKLKYAKYEEIKNVGGVWTAHKVTVRTVRGTQVESTTVLRLSSLRYDDPSVSDSDFTERRLEKGL